LFVSHRPLAIVSGLTLGDYLLWNWSLGANHEVLALVSGLTLPPLAIVFLWLTAVSIARLVTRSTLRARTRASENRVAGRKRAAAAQRSAARTGRAEHDPGSAAALSSAPSDKLAA
jgi:hypothetical protein